MLVLSRKAGERIRVGENITVVVTKIAGNRVTIGIDAPDSMRIIREELPASEAKTPESKHAEASLAEGAELEAVAPEASPVELARAVESMLEPHFADEPTTYQSAAASSRTPQSLSRSTGPRAPLAKIVRQRNRPQPVNVASRVSAGSERETHVSGAAMPGATTPTVTEVELAGVNLFSFAISTTF